MKLLNNIIIGTCFCFTGLLIRSTRTTITSAIMSSTTVSTEKESQATGATIEPKEYISGTHSVAFVTTPNEQSAKKIAHALVKEKLAACVNIVPQITSIYDWEGKINEDSEVLLMIKTKTERMNELTKFVRENHPYSVAEVISLPIENGNLPYLDWISKTVK